MKKCQMCDVLRLKPKQRPVAYLLMLAHHHGKVLALSRVQTAKDLGMARETTIRILSPLRKKGIIKTGRGITTIVDFKRLKRAIRD